MSDSPSTDTRPTVRYKKGDDHRLDGRWYVYLDDPFHGKVRVGWVVRTGLPGDDQGWSFYATVYEQFQGTRLAYGSSTRREAVAEGLSELRIRHGGRLRRFNLEKVADEVLYLDLSTLQAIWDRLLDEKYGLTPEKKAEVEKIMDDYRAANGFTKAASDG